MRLVGRFSHCLPFPRSRLLFNVVSAFKEVDHFLRKVAVGDQWLASALDLGTISDRT